MSTRRIELERVAGLLVEFGGEILRHDDAGMARVVELDDGGLRRPIDDIDQARADPRVHRIVGLDHELMTLVHEVDDAEPTRTLAVTEVDAQGLESSSAAINSESGCTSIVSTRPIELTHRSERNVRLFQSPMLVLKLNWMTAIVTTSISPITRLSTLPPVRDGWRNRF